ncbi:putative quinol monooxygenase [Muriicola sp. SD30]|uniref:putative quinol monooxygenase n=1 Tax=Muriicola sp. SD30 TaxID=3240936 RepID=UPI00351043A0
MSNIQVTAKFKIHPGKEEEFKELAQACMASVKEKDTGTLQYDWYFSRDGSECKVRETYINSDAVLAHVANLGPLFSQVLALSEFTPEIYGDASDALVGAVEVFKPEVYSHYQGL